MSGRRRFAVLLAAATLLVRCGAPARAQHEGHGGQSEIALTGLASKALLTRPIALRPEYGTLRQRVSTTNPEAQAYYDQGLALLASYVGVWHHGHNLHRLGMTELRLGNPARAEALLRQAARLDTRGALNGYHAAPLLGLFLLREGRVDEALAEARRLATRPSAMATAVAAVFEGEALLRLKRSDEARAAHGRAAAAVERLAGTVALPGSYSPGGRVRPSRDSLEAMRDLAGGDGAGGERALLARADEVAASPHLDAWAEGLVWLERASTLARQLGRQALADQLLTRITRIEPSDRPPLAASNPQP